MTRTPEVAANRLAGDNEFVLVDAGPNSDLTQMIAQSNDIRELRTLALQVADKCHRLLPSADQDVESDRLHVQIEQATQTDSDDGNDCVGNEKCVAEVDKLKKKLKEVVDMNVGWQLVHEQQEKAIMELRLQLQQQQQQLTGSPLAATSASTSHLSESTRKQWDQHAEQPSPKFDDSRNSDDLETWKRKCVQLEQDKNELEDTVRCLTSQLESMHELMRQLELTVDQQHNKLDSVIQEKQSFIDMLQAQILVYREDFQCERQDRERAQGKIVELKTELEQLKNRLAEQMTARQAVRASVAAFGQHPVVVNQYNDYYHHHNARVPPPAAATAPVRAGYPVPAPTPRETWFYPRGRDEVDCSTDGDDVRNDSLTSDSNLRNVSLDGVVTSDGPESKVHQPDIPENEASGVLRCPSCQKSYTMDQHVDLMDHMDACLAA